MDGWMVAHKHRHKSASTRMNTRTQTRTHAHPQFDSIRFDGDRPCRAHAGTPCRSGPNYAKSTTWTRNQVRLTWLCCTASPSFSTPHCATLTPGARTIAGSACAHARTHVGHAPHGCRRPPVGRVLQDRLLHALLVPLLRADERRFRHGRVRCVTGGGRSLLLPPCQ